MYVIGVISGVISGPMSFFKDRYNLAYEPIYVVGYTSIDRYYLAYEPIYVVHQYRSVLSGLWANLCSTPV